MITVKEKIERALTRALEELNVGDVGAFAVEKPQRPDYGDYASNVALIAGKAARKHPKEVARDMMHSEALREAPWRTEEKNGFLQFRLNNEAMIEMYGKLYGVLAQERGAILDDGAGKKVNVEFLSSNPTGEPHVGNVRSAFFGDVLANIYRACGYDVDKEFYINDAKVSNQILELGKTALGQADTYASPHLSALLVEIKQSKAFDALLRSAPKEQLYGEVGYFVASRMIDDFKRFSKEALRMEYDIWFSEQAMHEKAGVEKIVQWLKQKGLTYEKDGALWLASSRYGDEQDRVLVRSSGQMTYFAADIAYHKDKMDRTYDVIVDVWGADHQGHKKSMEAAMRILGYQGEFRVLVAQLALLKKDGKLLKLSKREGNVISIADLIKEVPIDAARMFYLAKSPDTHLEFDMALAKEQSAKNPVYYLQYAHARICGILRKTDVVINKPDIDAIEIETERELVLEILRFPEILRAAREKSEPHLLLSYARSLAEAFHRFYDHCPVLSEAERIKNRRLAIIIGTKETLKKIFEIFGVSAPEKM